MIPVFNTSFQNCSSRNVSENVFTVVIFRQFEMRDYVREKFITLAASLSLLIISSFSTKVSLLVDKNLSEVNEVTVFQNITISNVFFMKNFVVVLFHSF